MSKGRGTKAAARRPTSVKRGTSPRTTRKAQQQREPLLPRLLARLPFSPQAVRRFITAGSLALVALAGWWVAGFTGVRAWAHEELVAAVGRAGFEVKRVEVVGANRIDRLHVYDIVLREQNRSMAAVDLEEVRQGLLSYGWVGDARISRRLPDTLVVELVERTPTAIWQNQGRLSLIDANGDVLDDADVAAAADLPVVVGPGANRRMGDLNQLIDAAPALRPQITGATWVGGRRWDVRFRSGEVLALPEGGEAAETALATFARMDGVNRLLGRGIVRFDMRNPDRMVLRPGRGELRELQTAANGGGA